MPKRTVVLVILDGWGIGRNDPTNPIYIAQPQTINYIKANYQAGALQASGIAVGLPWGEEGNSEVGHLTIGAGKVIYQHYPRITMAIRNGQFFQNKVLLGAIEHAVKNRSALHLIGILSEGNVHASLEHLNALIEFAKKLGVAQINLHLFSDGKDSPPQSFLKLLEKVSPAGKLASVSGRHYALDRDQHWERTQQTYEVLTGNGPVINDLRSYVDKNYQRGLVDEFFEPVRLESGQSIKNNDALVFFNFREDSMRQIAAPFCLPNFSNFPSAGWRTNFKNLYIAAMTQYSDKFTNVQVAFPPEKIERPLGVVLAENDNLQLRLAETEKYAHVTYFFNGLKDIPLKNEFRLLVPSRNVFRHNEHPEMMVGEISNRLVQAVQEGEMDFILANFANPDVIAHTGDFQAAVKAIKFVDQELAKILKVILAGDAVLIITADHGNVEQMINPLTGIPETQHDPNPVPIYLVGNGFASQKDSAGINRSETEIVGILADVAPTVLSLLGLAKPAEMSGENLVGRLF